MDSAVEDGDTVASRAEEEERCLFVAVGEYQICADAFDDANVVEYAEMGIKQGSTKPLAHSAARARLTATPNGTTGESSKSIAAVALLDLVVPDNGALVSLATAAASSESESAAARRRAHHLRTGAGAADSQSKASRSSSGISAATQWSIASVDSGRPANSLVSLSLLFDQRGDETRFRAGHCK